MFLDPIPLLNELDLGMLHVITVDPFKNINWQKMKTLTCKYENKYQKSNILLHNNFR